MFSFIEFKLGDNLSRINYTESLGALFISAMALLSFRYLILHGIYDNLTDASFFYFNCGALIYFLGNLCFFATSNLIEKTEAYYWIGPNTLHAILNIALNSLLSVGFLKKNKSGGITQDCNLIKVNNEEEELSTLEMKNKVISLLEYPKEWTNKI
jgi:hypothetical protein